jgi:hypothetical protein
LRQAAFGLHFILAQTRPAAKCRLAQTLGIRECASSPLESLPENWRFTGFCALRSKKYEWAELVRFGCSSRIRAPSEVSLWLALRAGVLRPAVSQSGGAQSAPLCGTASRNRGARVLRESTNVASAQAQRPWRSAAWVNSDRVQHRVPCRRPNNPTTRRCHQMLVALSAV